MSYETRFARQMKQWKEIQDLRQERKKLAESNAKIKETARSNAQKIGELSKQIEDAFDKYNETW